jgi:hypothetical protein
MLIGMATAEIRPLTGPYTRAMARTGIKRDVLAALMRYETYSQLSAAMAGQQHLSVQRLLGLLRDVDGRRFLAWFVLEILIEEGFEIAAVLRAMRAEWITTVLVERAWQRVPVKAELVSNDERKRA